MTILAVIAFLVGALFGIRFKVFILIPSTIAVWTAIIGIGLARNEGLQPMLLSTVLTAILLQAGYLFGLLARWVMVSSAAKSRLARGAQDVESPAN